MVFKHYPFLVLTVLIVACNRTNDNVKHLDIQELTEFNSSIELGKALFFDRRLSKDSSISCASCHIPRLAFADNNIKSTGIDNHIAFRNTPSILNVKDAPTFMFDAHITSLEMQAIVPIQDTNEMGMLMGDLIQRLNRDPKYVRASKRIYGKPFDAWVLTRAISDYERTLISKNSKFDKYYFQNEKDALSPSALKGWKLFNEKLNCTQCHRLPNFTNYEALNNGLYADYGIDKGRYRIFGDSSDIGKFKVPSLRNVAMTYPYMHDGSIQKLEDVIRHYEAGGKHHVNQDKRISPFKLSDEERKNLILFLNALTDEKYVSD